MRGIGVGVQKANGDRFHALRLQRADSVPDFLFVERGGDAAVAERALLDADTSPARDQRLVWRNKEIVERDVDRLDAAPYFDAVAEAFGRDHTGLGAAPGQQDVGGERGAVHQNFDLTKKFAELDIIKTRRLLHRIQQADRRIARRRRGLEFLQQAGLVHDQAVGESAPHVDANALLFHFILPHSVVVKRRRLAERQHSAALRQHAPIAHNCPLITRLLFMPDNPVN